MSLKVKCEGAVDLPYDFLLMFNSNIVPNKAPLPYISIQNSMSDLEFDISRSLEVKSNDRVGLLINHFLLVSNSNHMSNSHPLGVIAIQFFPVSLSLGSNFAPPPPTTTTPDPFFNIEWFSLSVRGKASAKNEVDQFNIFCRYFEHRRTDRHTN